MKDARTAIILRRHREKERERERERGRKEPAPAICVCLCNKWLIKSNKFSKINTVIRRCAMGDEASNFRRSSRTGVSPPRARTGEDHGRTQILG